MPVQIRACGDFVVDDPVADRALGRGQAREVLALLCLHRATPLDTPAVIDALWDLDSPPTAATIVHGAVARIRKALGSGVVVRTDEGYALDPGRVAVDLWEIEDLAATGHLADARARLAEPILGPYATRAWAASAIASLHQRFDRLEPAGEGVIRLGGGGGGATITRLVGRRRELAALKEAHRRSRLVTVVGLGGVGKSRLVREAVGELTAEAVVRADLSLASGPFATRVAAELGTVATEEPGSVLLAVAAVLQGRATVLVLDGCDGDLDGAADGIALLLERCPRLSVVATSRVALGLPGEQVVPLLPFADPGDPFGDGVELALDRLRSLGLPLDVDDRQRAAAICLRCAGVPLAIELAADEVLGDAWGPVALSTPASAVRAVVAQTVANLAPPTAVAARRAALLPAGVRPAVLSGLNDRGTFAVRELLASGLVAVEGAGGRRRIRFPDTVREALLEHVGLTDLVATAAALVEVGKRARPDMTQVPVLPALADAVGEITNANSLLGSLDAAGRHHEQLELALAFATPWREDGHWATGSAAIERALAAVEEQGPLEPVWRAEVVLMAVTVAGTYERASRQADELLVAADVASVAGNTHLAAGLLLHAANGLGYAGRIDEAGRALATARSLVATSPVPLMRLYPEISVALGAMIVGRPRQAADDLAGLAVRFVELGAHSDSARVGRLAAIAARSAGDLSGALVQAEIAEEQATIGLARGTLASVRAEIADLRFALDPASAGPALESSLESAMAAAQLRTVGVCRLRLGLLADDLPTIARATVELLSTDGRWAALGLAHVATRLGDGHPLHAALTSAMSELDGWGSPLAATDEELVRATAAGAPPPAPGWDDELVSALLSF